MRKPFGSDRVGNKSGSAMVLIALAAVLAGVLYFRMWQTSHAERKYRDLKQLQDAGGRNVLESRTVQAGLAASSASQTAGPPVTFSELKRELARKHTSDNGQPGMTVAIEEKVGKLDEKQLIGLLEELNASDLTLKEAHDIRRILFMALFPLNHGKALELCKCLYNSDDMELRYMMGGHFQKWIDENLDEAAAWFDGMIERGNFPPIDMEGLNPAKMNIETQIFDRMIQVNVTRAVKRINRYSQDEKELILKNGAHSTVSEQHWPELSTIAAGFPKGSTARHNFIFGLMEGQCRETSFDDALRLASFFEPDEREYQKVFHAMFNTFAIAPGQYGNKSLDQRLDMVDQAMQQSPQAASAAFVQSVVLGTKYPNDERTEAAIRFANQYLEEHPSDDQIVSIINGVSRTSKLFAKEQFAELAAKLNDPSERERCLADLNSLENSQ